MYNYTQKAAAFFFGGGGGWQAKDYDDPYESCWREMDIVVVIECGFASQRVKAIIIR